MKWALPTVLILAALGASAPEAPTESPSSESHPPRREASTQARPEVILCFGDSITFGYGVAPVEKEAYPARLQRLLDGKYGEGAFKVVSSGVPGEDTTQGLARIDAVLAENKPQWVFILYGTNDLWTSRGVPRETTNANLRAMIRKALGDAAVIIATLPPVWRDEARVAEINGIIKVIAVEEDVPLVDLNGRLTAAIKSRGDFASESAWREFYNWSDEDRGLHPNENGYQIIAAAWLEALEKAFAGVKRTAVERDGSADDAP